MLFSTILFEHNSWGVPAQILYLWQSFLTGGRMIVRVNGHLSRKSPLGNGIPQRVVPFSSRTPGIDVVGLFGYNNPYNNGNPELVQRNLNVFFYQTVQNCIIEALLCAQKRNCICSSVLLEQNISVNVRMRILGIA